MTDYIWKRRSDCSIDNRLVKNYSKELNVPEVIIKLLFSRGINDLASCREFINLDDCYFPDPFSLPDMDAAVNRIISAGENKEKIYIFGDYDADGVTATVLLYKYLSARDFDVSYYIPSRFDEGYGINGKFIEFAAEENTDLIITVDNGISASGEIDYANDLGMDVIVTDHHTCPEILPNAVANVNPKRTDSVYVNPNLAGVGVALKLCMALEIKYTSDIENSIKNVALDYCYLASIGTIGDVMPLTGENRLIVKTGLMTFKKRNIQGVLSLLQKSGSKALPSTVTSQIIGFTICPRINAAGRMGDIEPALDLFLSDDKNECDTAAARLCEYNSLRQEDESNILLQAEEMIKEDADFENRKVIVLSSPDWSSGIIGIVSSKITEKYHRPSILISEGPDGVCKGSGRSISSFDLVGALNKCEEYLVRFGGHKLAAGLTLEKNNIDGFRNRINEIAGEFVDTKSPVTVEYDIKTESDDLNLRSAESITLLEPFGNGNPAPVFMDTGFVIQNKTGIGDNKHTKLTLSKNGHIYNAVYFSMSPEDIEAYDGDEIDILFNMNVNEYRNDRSLQFFIKKIRLSGSLSEKYNAADSEIDLFLSGKSEYLEKRYIPNRQELNGIYRYIRGRIVKGNAYFPLRKIIYDLNLDGFYGYYKAKLAVKIFDEISVLRIESLEGAGGCESCVLSIPDLNAKSRLDLSETFRKINSL